LETKSFDIAGARRFLDRKRAIRKAANTERWELADADCRKIVAMIIERYRPLRIYQWGSLLNREMFREWSDIDIAVEGIPGPEVFSSLYGDADRMTNFPLDLVEMERVHPLHAETIRTRGKLVYSRVEGNTTT
jgi:predicted nucleotidyltransferase